MNPVAAKLLPPIYGGYLNLMSHVSSTITGKQAYQVFSRVRRGKVRQYQLEFLDSGQDRRILVQDLEVQTYHWPGKGPTVLLVHGWESNTFRWRDLVAKLALANFNVVAFDAPGHGYSEGKYLDLPLFAECIQKMTELYGPNGFVGHSFGGLAILYNTYHRPQADTYQIATLGSPAKFSSIVGYYQRLLGLSAKVYDALDDHIVKQFDLPIASVNSIDYVRQTAHHGLIIHDRKDDITPFNDSQMVHDNWKNSRLMATEGLGHSLKDELVHDRVVRFLGSGS